MPNQANLFRKTYSTTVIDNYVQFDGDTPLKLAFSTLVRGTVSSNLKVVDHGLCPISFNHYFLEYGVKTCEINNA